MFLLQRRYRYNQVLAAHILERSRGKSRLLYKRTKKLVCKQQKDLIRNKNMINSYDKVIDKVNSELNKFMGS